MWSFMYVQKSWLLDPMYVIFVIFEINSKCDLNQSLHLFSKINSKKQKHFIHTLKVIFCQERTVSQPHLKWKKLNFHKIIT